MATILIDETPPGLFCMECLDDCSGRYHLRMQIVGHSAVGLLPKGLEPIEVPICELHVTNEDLVPLEELKSSSNRSKGRLAIRLQRVSVQKTLDSPRFYNECWPVTFGLNEHLLDNATETLFLNTLRTGQTLMQAYAVLYENLRRASRTDPFWRDCWRTFLADVRKTMGREKAKATVTEWGNILPRIEAWRSQHK